jgi:sterol 24-C-methyltransferase
LNIVASTNTYLKYEDHQRNAEFNKAMHSTSAQAEGGITAIFRKGSATKQATIDKYFKH